MASSSAALLAVLVVVSCAGMAAATSYTVGDTKGWVTGVDYSGWTSGKSFAVGDTLVFSYASKVHTVTEVSQGGYTSCSGRSSWPFLAPTLASHSRKRQYTACVVLFSYASKVHTVTEDLGPNVLFAIGF
uniref:Blue copper protein n=1 Tax=Aegilops tauschii TaxID=37682 RepID=M8B7I1_AEGTA